ncbi:TPA: hypothetical protein DCE37_03035 [Candidatus Latescibacteria bacterium]|nr:hypothetical protein [Candidatus Latescibacterota bacterium]
MSFKTTGILALLLVLLAGYIYIYEIKGYEEQAKAQEEARKVATVTKGTVGRLRLDKPGVSISAVRDSFEWRIQTPIETLGDYEMFEELLVSAGTLEKAGVAADSSQVSLPDFSLADYGLASPAIRISFEDAEGGPQEVAIGDRSPTGVYFYVKIAGDDLIYLAESRYYFQFDLTLDELRDKRYVRFDPDRVVGIELLHGEQRIDVKREDLRWLMVHPFDDLGDDVGIGTFLTDLRDARISSFASLDDDDPNGLEDPWFQIVIDEGKDGEKNGVVFGNKTGPRAYRRYQAKAHGNPYIFEADSSFVHHLLESGNSFRTRDVFAFNRHAADQVEFVYSDSTLSFARQGFESWSVESHPNHQIPGKRIEDFLDELNGLRATSYVSEGMDEQGRSVFESQGIRIRVLEKGALLREVVVGALDKHLFAATNDREQIVQIDPYFLGKIRDVRIHPKLGAEQG